jgi:hypothetical protein
MPRHWWWALPLLALTAPARIASPDSPTVMLSRVARDSMTIVFQRFNQHWNELADLNTLERMLGTIRPTQREYLGCLQGSVVAETIRVDDWVPAADMKQLQLAVTGSCDSVPRLVGTWHTHPYRADLENRPIKERHLSRQDLETFRRSPFRVTLVMWDGDSLDAAVKLRTRVIHPVAVVTGDR